MMEVGLNIVGVLIRLDWFYMEPGSLLYIEDALSYLVGEGLAMRQPKATEREDAK